MKSNESCLIRSDTVKVSGSLILFIIYYYHTERYLTEKGKLKNNSPNNFYRCTVRLDTEKNWLKYAEDLKKSDPAALITLKELGFENSDYTFKVWKVLTKSMASRWIKLKIKKAHSYYEFLNGRKSKYHRKYHPVHHRGAYDSDFPYIKEYIYNNHLYTIDRPEFLPMGVWMTTQRISPPRKETRIIKD